MDQEREGAIRALMIAKKTWSVLASNLEQESFSDLERSGVIKNFEVAFERVWKAGRKFLLFGGKEAAPMPREILRELAAVLVPEDGEAWLEMLKARNTIAHIYDEEASDTLVDSIRTRFAPLFPRLIAKLDEALSRE